MDGDGHMDILAADKYSRGLVLKNHGGAEAWLTMTESGLVEMVGGARGKAGKDKRRGEKMAGGVGGARRKQRKRVA